MPILDYQAIHIKPIACIRYVCNPQKTENGKLVSCSFSENLNGIDEEEINENFKYMFETFSGKSFRNTNDNKIAQKETIRLHQYFQSFSEEDSKRMTAEEAHKIGEQLCKEAFGEERYYLISTHTDKKHLHNHILVCPFDYNGHRWYANNTSLYALRKISDRIAIEHGLHIIEHPKHKNTLKYYEWLKRQQGISWKDEMRKDIDIAAINAESIDDLLIELEAKGYKLRKGKYLTLQIGLNKVRSYRLGDGYSMDDLQYRIENKNIIINNYRYNSELQFNVACYTGYLDRAKKAKTSNVGYAELKHNADLLLFLDKNNIQTENDFETMVNSVSEKVDVEKEEKKAIEKEISVLKNIITDSAEYLDLLEDELDTIQKRNRWKELRHIKNSGYRLNSLADIEKLEEKLKIFEQRLQEKQELIDELNQKKKEAASMVKLYMQNINMTDYDRIVAEMKAEIERQQQVAAYAKNVHQNTEKVKKQNELLRKNSKSL